MAERKRRVAALKKRIGGARARVLAQAAPTAGQVENDDVRQAERFVQHTDSPGVLPTSRKVANAVLKRRAIQEPPGQGPTSPGAEVSAGVGGGPGFTRGLTGARQGSRRFVGRESIPVSEDQFMQGGFKNARPSL